MNRAARHSAPAAVPPLSVNELVVGYRKPLFGPVSVRLEAGQVVALLGPNGSGKSTLLRTMAMLIPSLSGSIRYGDLDAAGMAEGERARRVAVVLTRVDFSTFLTVQEAVSLGRIPHTRWHGLPREEDVAIVRETLRRSGLEPWARRRIGELSDGERQRALIARAVAQSTPVIFLDEPTAHLDLSARHAVLLYLHRLAHETGVAVLFSTHDYDLAMQVADRLWVMDKDDLAIGAPEDLALDGVLDRVFGGRDTRFDPERGVFVRRRDRGTPILLHCRGPQDSRARSAHEWTRRALTRIGFDPVEQGEARLRIEMDVTAEHCRWSIHGKGEGGKPSHFDSIEGLLGGMG
jgi:iron complex transport system ATP-binding protein